MGDPEDNSKSLKNLEDDGWKKRETWSGKCDFFIACIGAAVGLGNVWRFPYLCYKNGGGAFLIPYFISVVVGGFPIFFLELAVGQFMNKGGPQAWSIAPLFQGIGLASIFIGVAESCYYIIVLAWSFFYLFSSFTSQLPWVECNNYWNTLRCSNNFSYTRNLTTGLTTRNVTDPVTEFWENKVLNLSDGLDEPGIIKWDLVLCLLMAWIVVYGCICKGIKSSGKVMYITATFPYIFMFILLIRNCTLEGSSEGIDFYLKANLTKLKESAVWVDAGTQVIFSWALGLGAITALGSYNKYNHNSLRDALAFSVLNVCTSILAGFIVFTILGFMAKQQGVLVSDVAESGPGLAFIAYPKAVAQLPLSPLWSVVFFIMLILLGLDSEFVCVEGVITAIVDQYPHFLRKGYRREIFLAIVCCLMFLIGLPMVSEGGMYVFQIFDYYLASRIILLIALSEVVAVSHCYGIRRFTDNLRMMIGHKWTRLTIPYLQVTWAVLTPLFCIVLFAISIYNYSDLTYKRPNHPEYIYPEWGVAIGWCISIFAVIWIPLVAIYRVIRLIKMGGRLSQGDFRLLLVPYYLLEHQKRPQDKHEQCLAVFEKKYNMQENSQEPTHLNINEESKAMRALVV